MKKIVSFTLSEKRFYLLIVTLATLYGYLLFKNLGHYCFWDDEANTVIFSKNLLHYGKLTAFDGRNVIAYGNGSELNSDLINTVIPPLQYYVAAVSIGILGDTNFAARFPFALMGFLCFFLFLVINIELTQKRGLILINLLIFSTNIGFILFMRQCRYYAPTTIFFLLNIYLLIRYFKHNKLGYLIAYTLSSTLLFLTQYNSALAILSTLALVYFYFKKWNFKEKPVSYFSAANLLIIVFIGFYFYYRNPFNTIALFPKNGLKIGYKFLTLYRFFISFDIQTFISYPLIIAFLISNKAVLGKNKLTKGMKQIGLFLLISIIVSSLFAVKASTRYISHLAPLAFALQGYILYQIWHWPIKHSGKIASITLALLLFTSSLYVSAGKKIAIPKNSEPVFSHFASYLKEIHSNYPSTYSTLVNYFKSKEEKDKIILVYPSYMAYPLMRYLGNQYLFTNQINVDAKINSKIPVYTYNNLTEPDFIVISNPDYLENKDKILDQHQSGYLLDSCINFYCTDVTRPEYKKRSFKVIDHFNHTKESIFIFRKLQ